MRIPIDAPENRLSDGVASLSSFELAVKAGFQLET
jgi:hypothetical protein